MKKLLIGLTVLTVFAFAGSASATWGFGSGQTVIGNDNATVVNNVTAVAKTGGNEIDNVTVTKQGHFDGKVSSGGADNYIETGDASATAGAINVVNSNVRSGCCWGKQKTIGNDSTQVNNDITAVAKTGGNEIDNITITKQGHFEKDITSGAAMNTIFTGNATSRAGAITVVNSNITRGF